MGPSPWVLSPRCHHEGRGCLNTWPEAELRVCWPRETDGDLTGSTYLLLGNQHPQPGSPERRDFEQGPELVGRTEPWPS